MPIAEILTGISLVKASVDFIKKNIETVNDIKGIAKQIDGFFTGVDQMNKSQGKSMSIAEQFGSVENSANDFINRKLLEEQRTELKNIINLRFGPTTWDEILSERATRINQAKEAMRLQRVEARQKQKELVDTLQTMGIIFCVIGVVIISFIVSFKAFADGYTYKPKPYTKKQLQNQGKIETPKYTTCRLKKRIKSKSGDMACIYVGGNKTYEMMIESWCPKQYKCIYNPWGQEPNIDDVINSLNNAVK